MAGWPAKVLKRIKERAAGRGVLFTLKARRELANLDLGLDEDDACDVLVNLMTEDSAGRLKSSATGEWMYVFKPQFSGMVLYIKLILRSNCVVISFHEDTSDGHEENA
jgi:MqsR (Motility quorum-sensing regulator) toxin of toxin-antitoxin system